MISAFRETAASIRNSAYGQNIIAATTKHSLWYWSKYFILFSAIPLLIFIATVTYYFPQIPALLQKNLPVGQLNIKQGQLTTDIKPLVFKNSDFYFSLDPNATPSALPTDTPSLLIASEAAYYRDPSGQILTRSYSGIPDFSVTSSQVISFIRDHLFILWLITCLILIILAGVAAGFTWIFRILSSLIWAGVIYLAVRFVFRKSLTFPGAFNISVYASVIILLLSSVVSFLPFEIGILINSAVTLGLSYYWLRGVLK